MKSIGGFFELELPEKIISYHKEAISLSTGRACIRLMIRNLNIAKCYVPYYTCDAVYHPFTLEAIPIVYYGIDKQMNPINLPELKKDEYFLYINYFGVKYATVDKLIEKYGNRLLIDNTHQFFHKGYPDNWSFTSARKYFGVPDGAYLYSPKVIDTNFERFTGISIEHNIKRFMEDDSAYAAYERHEKSLTSEINRISTFSERLLSVVDYEEVKRRRVNNFKYLHQKFANKNLLNLPDDMTEVPFAYPLLPINHIPKDTFYKDGIFIPSLWLDPVKRNTPTYDTDQKIGLNLLPLPIDHRYNEDDMDLLFYKINPYL